MGVAQRAARRGGSHVARAHMTGGVMDRLPGEPSAAPVAAAAEAEADEEADPPAAGTAGGPLAIAPGPGPPPRDPAALGSLAERWRPARPCHAAERAAGPGTRAPAQVCPGRASLCKPLGAEARPPVPQYPHSAPRGAAPAGRVGRSPGTWRGSDKKSRRPGFVSSYPQPGQISPSSASAPGDERQHGKA